MARGPDPKALALRRHDARELMKRADFRRLAAWLVAPTKQLPYDSESERATAFKAGYWFAANELRELLRQVDFDGYQRLEREARRASVAHGVHESPDSSDS